MHKPRLVAALAVAASLLAACGGGGGSSMSSIPPMDTLPQGQTISPSAYNFTNAALTHALIDETGRAIPGSHVMFTRDMQEHARATMIHAASNNLVYNNGPVQTHVKWAVDYWGFKKDPYNMRARLTNFLKVVGGSSWLSTDNQYYQIVGGTKTFITNPSGNFVGAWTDTANAIPAHPGDAQIAAEAQRAANHFGVSGTQVNIIVVTAPGHGSPGFGSQWCGYHNSNTAGTLVYTDLGYMPYAGSGCGAGSVNSPGKLDGVTIVGGHEIAEAQTDPSVNPNATGWIDSSGQENGDKCAWTNLQETNFGTKSFPTQPIWSNSANGCVQ